MIMARNEQGFEGAFTTDVGYEVIEAIWLLSPRSISRTLISRSKGLSAVGSDRLDVCSKAKASWYRRSRYRTDFRRLGMA